MTLEIVFVLIYAWAVGASIWSGAEMKKFLITTPMISDSLSLERFKALARRNMYMALVQLVVLGIGVILGVLIISRDGFIGFIGVMFANITLFAFGRHLGRLEKQARSLSSSSDVLREEHRRVSETWVRKPLPNF